MVLFDAADLPTGSATSFIYDSAKITVAVTDADQENGCPYNDVGSPKNRYDIAIKYSLANSPSIVHTLNGEMFASAPSG